MAVVQIRVNSRDYALACDEGQEEQLRFLADEVDDRVRSLVFSIGSNPGEAMALLMAALTMADEIIENKKQIQYLESLMAEDARSAGESRLTEIEEAMAVTLDEIALRIEKIAQQVELR